MWKFNRNLNFLRWGCHKAKNSQSADKAPTGPRTLSVVQVSQSGDHSKEGKQEKKKDKNNRESERYWNQSHFQHLLFRSSFLETAGWLGTVTILCFDLHFKHLQFIYDNGRPPRSHNCLFARNVLAMPQSRNQVVDNDSESTISEKSSAPDVEEQSSSNNDSDDIIIRRLKNTNDHVTALTANSEGLKVMNSNMKRAFKYFQIAAKLGSSQGLYNLGVCYELGKGTKVNLTKAAFCYRRAAMKGHGMASYNLAMYFLKGLGNMPMDQQMGRQLLEEAANRKVPEAQMFLGLEYLEEKKYSEAFQMFKVLAENNDLNAKYYLGLCYENGWGVEKNRKVSLEILSQSAVLGHSKSVLQLSKCFEEGADGCESDLDFATALCQIVADQGDQEAIETLSRLQSKRKVEAQMNREANTLSSKSHKNGMHGSSSFPTLANEPSPKITSSCGRYISSYLDLVMHFLPKQLTSRPTTQQKSLFYIGEEKPKFSYTSNVYVPCEHTAKKSSVTATV